MENLADRLQKALELAKPNQAGKTNQAWLAKGVGISTAAMSKWFTGETKEVEATNLIRAALLLGVNPIWLALGSGQINQQDDDESKSTRNELENLRADLSNADRMLGETTRRLQQILEWQRNAMLEIGFKETDDFASAWTFLLNTTKSRK